MMKRSIFQIRRNCSNIKNIDQLAVLIDGHEYYQAFFNVARRAQHSINILGWEVESRLGIGHINNLFPNNMRDFFKHLAKKNQMLHVNILSWHSPFYLLFDRERNATTKWKMRTPGNVHFRQKRHPDLYGTYHEKIATIDRNCAFLGGMDITQKRWDTSDHVLHNPLRTDSNGNLYHPFHDVQIVCTGELAQELTRYVENRSNVNLPETAEQTLWPEGVNPQLENVKAAISFTNGPEKKFEIEALYLDAIEEAENFIYIENQFFSSHTITKQLARKLKDPTGPEIVIVLPMSYRGLFEKSIYLNELHKAIRKLKKADIYKRLKFYYPSVSNHDSSRFIVVHSKVMIVDNEFITIGSANLNSRSMRVDGEVNVSLESLDKAEVTRFIAQTLHRLLSEHLGINPERFKIEFDKSSSIIQAINHFQDHHERTLRAIPPFNKTLKDYLLISLTPFVDIKYPLLKTHFVIFIFVVLIMSLIYIQDM